MKASHILDVPEDVLTTTRMTLEDIRLELAVALFRLDRLSMGKAAESVGVPTGSFQHHLAGCRTGPHYDVVDVLEDAAALAALPRCVNMIVVADSSPLIALCRIGRLELLRDLFGIFIIPNAVRAEVSVSHAEKEGAKKALSADWIERQAVRDIPLVRLLRHDFGAGECQAILLAREVEAAHNANERTPWQDGSETLGPYPHGSGRDAD